MKKLTSIYPNPNPNVHHTSTLTQTLTQTLTLTSSMKKSVTGKINFCTLAGDRQNIHFVLCFIVQTTAVVILIDV